LSFKPDKKENALIDKFLDHLWLEDGLSRNTLSSYRFDLYNFSNWLNKTNSIFLENVTKSDIQQYLSFKFPSSKARSISRSLSTLRRFYRFLYREKKITTDPTLQIQKPKIPKSLPKSLSEDEVENLLEAPDLNIDIGIRDKAMIELLYACGLRVSELVNIQLTELNLDDGVIRVTGKGDKTRLVPMGEDAMDYIQKYLLSARGAILKNKKSKYLFVTHHGKSMTRQTFWHSLKKYADCKY